MNKVKFSKKNYPTQHDAYVAWELAKDLLTKHNIPFRIDVYDHTVFITTEFTGKMEMSKVFTIDFENESDLTAYNLIKD